MGPGSLLEEPTTVWECESCVADAPADAQPDIPADPTANSAANPAANGGPDRSANGGPNGLPQRRPNGDTYSGAKRGPNEGPNNGSDRGSDVGAGGGGELPELLSAGLLQLRADGSPSLPLPSCDDGHRELRAAGRA